MLAVCVYRPTYPMSWLQRQDLEALERDQLAPGAAFSAESGGRRVVEPEDPLRTAFQRDRDRIIHSTAFRRLQHKTQVFSSDEGDHYRSRMTHSLEVSQMARSVAHALRLNSDLAEAVALAHDLGHPPFGHVGEDALHELMKEHGGFRHNAQGARIVDLLEDRRGDGQGLNLTWATRLSLVKGKVPDGFPLSEDLRTDDQPPLEAVVVDRCDKIAYLCHDLDDAMRAGIVTRDQASELGLWMLAREQVQDESDARIQSEMVSIQVRDLVEASVAEIATAMPRPAIRHSALVTVQSQELLAFLRENFYRSDRVLQAMEVGSKKIESCFEQLLKDPDALPPNLRSRVDEIGAERVVCDYIAGMTDRYLMRQ